MLLAQERGLENAEEFVAAVLADMEGSALDESEKALLRFVRQVNRHSPDIAPADFEQLRAHGWQDDAIYYAITVCALFNFYNRWVDATGVHALSDEAHREGAKRSAMAGYVRK